MSKKLYVGNLPYSFRSDDLKSLFEEFGTVVSSMVITDKMSGRSKGFGFVEMSSEDEAQSAISATNGKEVEGRALVVNEARPQEDRPRNSNSNFRGRR